MKDGSIRDAGFEEESFAEIEAEKKKIVKENLRLKHFTANRKKALQAMYERNEIYKWEFAGG